MSLGELGRLAAAPILPSDISPTIPMTMSLGATRIPTPEDVSPTIPMTVGLGRRLGQFEDWGDYDVGYEYGDPGYDLGFDPNFDVGYEYETGPFDFGEPYDFGFDPTLDYTDVVPVGDVFPTYDPYDTGGDTMYLGQDTPMTVALPNGQEVTVASFDDYGNLYLADGRIYTADGNLIDPNAPGGATIQYTDAFGNLQTNQAAADIVDPGTGWTISSGDWLKSASSLLDLAAKAKQLITGQAPTSSGMAQGPVSVGGGRWRLPNGQIVTGTKQPNGTYLLPNGQIVPAPPSGWLGGMGIGTIGLIAAGGLALILFMRK